MQRLPSASGVYWKPSANSREFSVRSHTVLLGVDNGKAVGTYLERELGAFLVSRGVIQAADIGNSASGIDLLSLEIDVKFTSVKQPQSSSPFRSFKQKIEGLGHHLLVFVYEKRDTNSECFLPLRSVRFVPKERTADYQTTKGVRDIIARAGNADDLFAFLVERMIPADEHTLAEYARHLREHPPAQGYLTVSNALQWRLQYGRVVGSPLEGVVVLDPDDVVTTEADNDIVLQRQQNDAVILPADTAVDVSDMG